jgi:thiol-disulfide isomerase/thioredoxin/DsbC/DsbD-like thiol-disulfide interchange protein
MRPAIVLLVLSFFASASALAQGLRPSPRLQALVETDGVPAGANVRLALRVTLPAGFHVQSNAPRDPSLVPTLLTLTPPAGVTVEEVIYPASSDLQQAGQAQALAVFGPDLVIGVRLAVAAGVAPGPIEVHGRLRYQACDDKVCYTPVTTEVAWAVRVVAAGAAVVPENPAVFGPATATALPAAGIVTAVRAANAARDFARGEKLLADYRMAHGATAEYLLAHSWLGRGALAAGQLDRAEEYARDTYNLCLAELLRRPMDRETQLPTAFGAAIEVIGQTMAARGARSEAVAFLNSQLKAYGDTSIAKRTQKNLNLISLEGTEAPALDLSETQGGAAPTLASLKGRVVVLFFWAHWCPDCKEQGPILGRLLSKYSSQVLQVLAPTQRYGYGEAGATVGPEEEVRYIGEVRRQSYAALAEVPVPLSAANHLRYGVSTTPTIVIVDRGGIVRSYHPGKMSEAELDAAIRKLL